MMGRGRGKSATYPNEVEMGLDLIKENGELLRLRLRPRTRPLDVPKEPLSFWQQFWSGDKHQPNIREYLAEIEERQFQLHGINIDTLLGSDGRDEEKNGLLKKDGALQSKWGISPNEALRRRQRKAWKAIWAEVFPPPLAPPHHSKTTSKKKHAGIVGKEEVAAGMGESEAKEGLVMEQPVTVSSSSASASTVHMQSILELVGAIKELQVIKKAITNL